MSKLLFQDAKKRLAAGVEFYRGALTTPDRDEKVRATVKPIRQIFALRLPLP